MTAIHLTTHVAASFIGTMIGVVGLELLLPLARKISHFVRENWSSITVPLSATAAFVFTVSVLYLNKI